VRWIKWRQAGLREESREARQQRRLEAQARVERLSGKATVGPDPSAEPCRQTPEVGGGKKSGQAGQQRLESGL